MEQNSSINITIDDYQLDLKKDKVIFCTPLNVMQIPKTQGKYSPENHKKTAYVKAPVADGQTSKTGIVELEAGEYEYFCPINPTPKYSLIVL